MDGAWLSPRLPGGAGGAPSLGGSPKARLDGAGEEGVVPMVGAGMRWALSSPPTQPNATQSNPTQPNSTQPNATQHNPTQPNPTQRSPNQPNATQHNSIQHNTTQLNPTQPNTTQHNPTQPNPTQRNPRHDSVPPLAGPTREQLYPGLHRFCRLRGLDVPQGLVQQDVTSWSVRLQVHLGGQKDREPSGWDAGRH